MDGIALNEPGYSVHLQSELLDLTKKILNEKITLFTNNVSRLSFNSENKVK